MASRGRVRIWHNEEGCGVIDSESTPGGCWAHFSAVRVPGYLETSRYCLSSRPRTRTATRFARCRCGPPMSPQN